MRPCLSLDRKEVREMKFLNDERGSNLTEYAVIIILILVAAYGALRAFGLSVSELFNWLAGLF